MGRPTRNPNVWSKNNETQGSAPSK
jgi:hypothetical protein